MRDPGALFAERAGGEIIVEDDWTPAADTYDFVLALGTLDTVNDLPRALKSIAQSMRAGIVVFGRAVRGRHPAAAAERHARRRSRDRNRLAPHPSPHRSFGACTAPCSGGVRHAGGRRRSGAGLLRINRPPHCRSSKDGCDKHTLRKIARRLVQARVGGGTAMFCRSRRWPAHRRNLRNSPLRRLDANSIPHRIDE